MPFKTMPPMVQQGRCPCCGHIRTLGKTGAMRQHARLGSDICKGSFKKPKG